MLRNGYWRRFWAAEYQKQLSELDPNAEPLAGSERATLIEAIADRFPFRRILEIGSGFGQNGTVLGPLFPSAEIIGLDPSTSSILQGQRILSGAGINNVQLVEGFGHDLSRFPDGRFDLVFSCASLLYVGPDRIEQTAREMLRVVRRRGAVLVLEQSFGTGDWGGVKFERPHPSTGYGSPTGYWIRDYRALFRLMAAEEAVQLYPVENPIWAAEQWKEYASIIEVEKD